MRDERVNQINAEIQTLTNLKRQLREQEKGLEARARVLGSQAQYKSKNVKELKTSLAGNLPDHLLPANVGALNEVAWPFFFQVNLDFGNDPSLSQSMTPAKGFFQVDQEASFLLMSVSASFSNNTMNESAIRYAPVQVELIDRQSSRRFNNAPIPLQMIGSNSNPMIFPTPMLIMPNAILDVQATGMQHTPNAYAGSGRFQLSFFGYRTRIENAQNVLSTVFG